MCLNLGRSNQIQLKPYQQNRVTIWNHGKRSKKLKTFGQKMTLNIRISLVFLSNSDNDDFQQMCIWFHAQLDKKSLAVSSVGFSVKNIVCTLWSVNEGAAVYLWKSRRTSGNLREAAATSSQIFYQYHRVSGGFRPLHH